jgi:hypothetical protein
MPEPIRPVIFVGLGSTGARIISQIKHRLDEHAEPFARQFYRYVRVTSERVAEPGVDDNIPGICLSGGTEDPRKILENFSNHETPAVRESFLKWWPRDQQDPSQPWIPPVDRLDLGAGGKRSVGRLLLHYHSLRNSIADDFKDLKKSLTDTRARLPVADQPKVSDRDVTCYVFGLLAGGTCSGTFIELALLIKQGLGQCNLFGVFLLGDICYLLENSTQRDAAASATQEANTAAALAEISFLCSTTGRALAKKNWSRFIGSQELPDTTFDRNPYHTITLVGAKNDNDVHLGGFSSYQDFIASYYSSLHLTEANLLRIGKIVDEQSNNATTIDMKHAARANSIERIGMLRICAPVEKSRALLRRALMDAVLTQREKNANEAVWRQLADSFKNSISWSNLGSHFSPPEETICGSEIDPPPDGRAELSGVVDQMRKDLDAFYAPWLDVSSGSVQAKCNSFQKLYQGQLQTLLNGALSGSAGRGLSLGNLHSAVKSLQADTLDQVKMQTAALTAKDQAINGPEATSLKKLVEADLAAAVENYPKKRTWFKKGSGESALEALKRYSLGMRSLAVLRGVNRGLAALENELSTLAASHKLIQGVLVQAAAEESAQVDRAFKNRGGRESVEIELVKTQDELKSAVVAEIMGTEGTATDVSVAATEDVIAGWRATSGDNIQKAYNSLMDLLRDRGDSRTETLALRVPGVATLVQDLRKNHGRSFAEAFERHLSPVLDKKTVWDYMRMEVEAGLRVDPNDSAEKFLKRTFQELGSRLGCFGVMDPGAGRDAFNLYSKRVEFVCDETDAAKCFNDLGITSPGTFLGSLTAATLGASYTPLSGGSPHEIVVYSRRRGDSPVFFGGFSDVSSLLSARDDRAGAASAYDWTDQRFPEWIKEWHQNPAKPLLLEE